MTKLKYLLAVASFTLFIAAGSVSAQTVRIDFSGGDFAVGGEDTGTWTSGSLIFDSSLPLSGPAIGPAVTTSIGQGCMFDAGAVNCVAPIIGFSIAIQHDSAFVFTDINMNPAVVYANPNGPLLFISFLNGIAPGTTGTFGIAEAACAFISQTDTNCGDLSGLTGRSGLGSYTVSAVPLPAAAWLFISALAGLFGAKRYKAT